MANKMAANDINVMLATSASAVDYASIPINCGNSTQTANKLPNSSQSISIAAEKPSPAI